MTNIKTLLVRTKNIRKFNNQILAILLYCIFGIGSAMAMSPPPPEPSPEPWFPQVDFVPGIPSLSLNFIGDEIRLTWNATEHAEYYPVYVYYDNQWRHLEDSHGTQVDYNDQQRGWNPNELQFKILVFVEVRGEESNKVRLEILSSDVSINFGDNGSLNDDTYALYVNSNLIHTMPSPTRSAGPFNLALSLGRHYVSLRGVTAPDDIGTYFISFSGNVRVLNGPPLSGSDLTAGVQKNWVVEVFASTNSSTLREMDDTKQSIPIIWQE